MDRPIFLLTPWDLTKFGIWVWTIIILTDFAINYFNLALDATDVDGFHRSGVRIVYDAGTGCEYLKTPEGHLTPRLGGKGEQKCR